MFGEGFLILIGNRNHQFTILPVLFVGQLTDVEGAIAGVEHECQHLALVLHLLFGNQEGHVPINDTVWEQNCINEDEESEKC